MTVDHSMLKRVYEAFNARDIDTVLASMQPDVDWPNGWEGGRVSGHSGVRDYWSRQWAVIDPRVEPVAFHDEGPDRIAVDVHAVIRDHDGKLLDDHMVQHVYSIEDGLIRSMEIREVK